MPYYKSKTKSPPKAKSVDDRLREEIILTTTCEWIRADPDGARDFALETKAMKAGQKKASGGTTGAGDKAGLHVTYRMPQVLLDCIRLSLSWAERKYKTKFEVFGLDDADMKLLVRKFPVLFGHAHNMTWGKSK